MSGFQQVATDISLDDASSMFNSIDGKIRQALAQKGFAGAPAPPMIQDPSSGQAVPYNGSIPPDLTALDDRNLGWYLGMLSGWLEYVNEQLAWAHGDMSRTAKKLEFVDAHLYMVHKKEGLEGKKRPEQERKSMVLIDRRYVEAQAEAMYYETYYRHVKAIANAAEQNFAAVSRRITQRQQDIERQKRVTGVGGISGGAFFRQP